MVCDWRGLAPLVAHQSSLGGTIGCHGNRRHHHREHVQRVVDWLGVALERGDLRGVVLHTFLMMMGAWLLYTIVAFTPLRSPPPLLYSHRRPAATFTPLACASDFFYLDEGLNKTITQTSKQTDASTPPWGALVNILFTGRFTNGTIFDKGHAEKPFEFQLNTNAVVDGMERGVKSMLPGEAATLMCDSRWAYAGAGVGNRIPPNETLVYDVELLRWEDGPPIDFDQQDFDVRTYRASLEGKKSGSGQTPEYRWVEGGEEVTLWLPLNDGEGARDIYCDFRTKELTVRINGEGGGGVVEVREVAGNLKGRAVPDESYWVIDEDVNEDGKRELQVVLAKAGVYTKWDGVLINEPEG